MIQPDTLVEDLVDEVPEAVAYLIEKRIHCIACGAPIWGTLEEAAGAQGYSDEEIQEIVAELRELRAGRQPG